MGKDFWSNTGRAIGYSIERGGLQDEHPNDISGGLVDSDGDRHEKLGFAHANWQSIVTTVSYLAMHTKQTSQWGRLSDAEKEMLKAARREERKHRNRYDMRQASINYFSVQYQKEGHNTMDAYSLAQEARRALDGERFCLLARAYTAYLDSVSLDAIRKRVKKYPRMQSDMNYLLMTDAHACDVLREYPMRYGNHAEEKIRQWFSRTAPEPLESVVKSRRCDAMRMCWLAWHISDFYEEGNLPPVWAMWNSEIEQECDEVAQILTDAGITAGPEGPYGQIWGC